MPSSGVVIRRYPPTAPKNLPVPRCSEMLPHQSSRLPLLSVLAVTDRCMLCIVFERGRPPKPPSSGLGVPALGGTQASICLRGHGTLL